MRKLLLSLAFLPLACATGGGSARLAELADRYWQRELAQNAGTRADLGLPVEHLPEISYAQAERDAAFARELLASLERIDETKLTDDERITLAILEHLQRETVDSLPHYWLQFPVTPYASPIRGVNLVFARLPFATDADQARYLRLLDEHARFIDQIADVVREQQRRGILLPKPEIAIARTLFTTAALQRDDERVRAKIAGTNEPAMARLAAIFSPEYEASAPNEVGLERQPGGMEAYRQLVRVHTTTTLTPEEIHQLGLREVARINEEMEAVRGQLGFTGTKAEFHQHLRSDPRFFASSADEIGDRLMAQVRRIEPHVPRLFAASPRAPYGVARLEPALEPAMTFGYYQQPTSSEATGRYLYNGSKLNERNLLFAPALMAHELVPGHHFQIARQLENESIPPFRRRRSDTAFVEGWGEYAAWLGNEMKLYDDPYDRYGRLMMDMLLSTRLVVDTGMNALDWPRERAMQFMRENTLLSDTEIATETLRYAVDIPGQALAYKIGSLRMIELRRNAERELGDRFDVRAFHEWLIGSGSMPLDVLEQHVRRRAGFSRAE
jgi:uncharacterized protein (DUF885 family)